ncbi:Nn.00g088780.m01.CDS01 [Neocucurbitaria sp. VM-36]
MQYGFLALIFITLGLKAYQYKYFVVLRPTSTFQLKPDAFRPSKTVCRAYKHCSSGKVSGSQQYEFNVTSEGSSARQWQIQDSSLPELSDELRGRVIVETGSPFQTSDIDVRVVVKSSSEAGFHSVLLHTTDHALYVDYAATHNETCIEVLILVFIRPQKRSLDLFNIRTEVLGIWIKESLNWEINNLVAHTSHGNFLMEANAKDEKLMAHNISVSSINGTIYGWFAADEVLNLHNIQGFVGAFLVPPRTAWFDIKRINISTATGEVFVQATLDLWPVKSYTHETNIRTVSGDISAQIAHGRYTNITSVSGQVAAYIRPYATFSFDTANELYTSNKVGKVTVIVDNPWVLETGVDWHNPLWDMVSEHNVEEGKLEIKYGSSWYGELEAWVNSGTLEFDASDLEWLERRKGYLRARRGREGRSRMLARVGTGDLDIGIRV